MSSPNQPPSRDPDSLAGSPELFATNLLLVRAIENQIDRIEIKRHESEITVQLHKDQEEYDRETLTEDVSAWEDIVERFRDQTSFDGDDAGQLEPSIPAAQKIESIPISYTDDQISLKFNY